MKALLRILNISRLEAIRITVLGVIAAVASTVVLYSLSRPLATQAEQISSMRIFAVGLIVFVASRRTLVSRLVEQAERSTKDIRLQIVHQLIACRLPEFETIGRVNILSTIIQDASVLGELWPTLAYSIVSAITLVSSLAYLAILAPFEFVITIGLIILCVGVYLLESKGAHQSLQKARESYDSILVLIDDLLDGFKEIKLDLNRRASLYLPDLHQRYERFVSASSLGKRRLSQSSITGATAFFFLVGGVIFFFPFSEEPSSRFTFAATMLYLINPMTILLGNMPQLSAAHVAARRVQNLQRLLIAAQEPGCQSTEIAPKRLLNENWQTICLDNVEYFYNRGQANFKLGPVSLTIERGTVTFIVGANGSGKSTLGKVLTGLYRPSRGRIFVDGHVIEDDMPDEYRQFFSAIFFDYHLFDTLSTAGDEHRKSIRPLLKSLGLHEDILANVDRDSCPRLSQGQHRRLSLAIACLQDRPIYFFDEWAADQDPEFRIYFYQHVLPELKAKGKTIIAITHDDRFFAVADQIVRMERGGHHVAHMPTQADAAAEPA